ncbi:MAG: cytochrome oxidase subunit II [Leptospiraceae bacterium]|nr:cytochrome oxidase subunit II [Leptospiraceae bacterium]
MSEENSRIPKELTWYEKLSAKVESHGLKLTIWTTIAILIGGAVEIPPFFMMGEVKKIESVTPFSAPELAGRDVYQAEGCFYCHTQLIRPFRWETQRWDPNLAYGEAPYSKAGEFVYDHPFLWGSKRTGPDLSHEASIRPSAAWHAEHLINPRDAVDNSPMPAYPHLFLEPVDAEQTIANMRALATIGVPYKPTDFQLAKNLLIKECSEQDQKNVKRAMVMKGYSEAEIEAGVCKLGEVVPITKGDALVSYLLKLGRDTTSVAMEKAAEANKSDVADASEDPEDQNGN